jgi:septal ring factor EnvC (AmiA/AmiB activator)
MPRGVKREKNIPEEIAAVSTQIAKHEAAIKSLKSQLASLQEEQEQTELRNLNRLLKETGLSTRDLANIIVKPKEEIA